MDNYTELENSGGPPEYAVEDDIDVMKILVERFTVRGVEAKITEEELSYEDEDGRPASMTHRSVDAKIPVGNGHREISIVEGSNALRLARDSQVELWRFVEGYDAIWSPATNEVECVIVGANRFVLSRILQAIDASAEVPDISDIPEIEFPSPAGISIRIGSASNESAILSGPGLANRRRPTLKLRGDAINTHDHAKDILERIGNSVFLQIDFATQAAMYLQRERSGLSVRMPRRRDWSPASPSHEYDSEPMELYWYARSARGMPLLQYLAFYQVLEFYYPIYAEKQAQKIVKDRFKDPLFDIHREADLSALLSAIRIATAGRGFGDERSQLSATIQECVTPDELRQFIEDDKQRKEFLSSNKGADSVVRGHTINLTKNATGDLRGDVVDRVYAIRCRIVHSKAGFDDSEGSGSMMLPFSPESRALAHDISLISFLAREVLVAGSRPLRLTL